MSQATSLCPIPQPRLQTGLNLYLKFPRFQRILLSQKSSVGHFMGPIWNSIYVGVEWNDSALGVATDFGVECTARFA